MMMLNNQEKKNSFIGKLSDVVNQQKFEVISATIQKEALKKHYRYDNNPYHIALNDIIPLKDCGFSVDTKPLWIHSGFLLSRKTLLLTILS
jgi:hypothetical protein